MSDPRIRLALLDATSGPWLPIPPGAFGVDTNTADVFTLAIALEDHGVAYPKDLPSKTIGIAIVNEVETFVDVQPVIRFLPRQTIVERALDLLTRLQKAKLIEEPPLTQLAVAFSTWHGCINMAKSLRYDTSDGTVYTQDIRMREYEDLRRQWMDEEARGNPWIRYGVGLARAFELARGNRPNDADIPRDSPYWT
jgi:hypothetical protein